MSVKRTKRRRESQQRKLKQHMMNDPDFIRCGFCRAYNRRTVTECWKCGEDPSS